jgi:hypothetical protein
VSLVEAQPPEPDHPTGSFVEVFESADANLMPIVASILHGAGIPFLVQGGETSGGLFPLGSVGGGSDERLLRAIVKVPAEHVEAARALLIEADEVPEYVGEPEELSGYESE